ncbi:MAG TPA: glycosyltransferase [Candidatus Bathyarchaeia archaeon]|nr:glycosyltransferase [Candidatus Bathyarchaeia archaeon]
MSVLTSLDGNIRVSVVILTKNSAATICRSLESALSQSRPPDEVVVVDGSSVDGTKDILRKYPVKIVEEPGLGFGHARNVGLNNASGDIVFFLDSDCYAEPLWIQNALKALQNPDITAVTGPTLLWNKESTVARFLAFVRDRVEISKESRLVEIAPTMNLALRKNVIETVGMFDASLVRGEDTDLTYRISRKEKILWDPSVRIWFKGSPNFWKASRKCVDHFIGMGQLFAKHGFKKLFVSSMLPIRGILLILAIASALLGAWPLALGTAAILLCDLTYKMAKMALKYRDSCIVYYLIFFTWWSLTSLAVFWGFFLGRSKAYKKINSAL